MGYTKDIYRIPGAITVSRATGKIIGIEMVEATKRQYMMMASWICKANGYDEQAEILRPKPEQPKRPEPEVTLAGIL